MQKEMTSRLGLGTVQFGSDYGINNKTGKVTREELARILDCAAQAGVTYLDTASLYGDSERILGQYLKSKEDRFHVVSKCKTFDIYSRDGIRINVKESLHLLGLNRIYGYLIHQFGDYKRFPQLFSDLLELKEEGLIKKVGFSLYLPEELDFLLEQKIEFTLLQVPYSIFDRRFEPYFSSLKERGIEIHVRSLFLQGLAFMDEENLPFSLKGAGPQLQALKKISLASGLSREEICLNFGFMNPNIDQFIFGVDSLQQLQLNLSALDAHPRMALLSGGLKKIQINDEKILLPYHWS